VPDRALAVYKVSLRESPQVFSTRDLAQAAGVSLNQVQAWVEAGAIRTLPAGDAQTWIGEDEAIRAGRAILTGTIGAALTIDQASAEALFESHAEAARAMKAPFAVSSSLHAGLVAAIVLVTTLGIGSTATAPKDEPVAPEKVRLVYLALPGPGGGGGGGGLKQKIAPPKALRKGSRSVNSPLPMRELPKVEPVVKPKDPEPPKVEPEPLPPVKAPVVTAPADDRDRAGVLEQSKTETDSRGSGRDGGVGTGAGTGIGEGQGSGIGEGSGGGTGGGPYRPGSGITPPSLLREVKPDYSEDARRRNIEGDVVMEIVVRHDGSVGEVRVLQGLGHGLDERAIAAVRQWRFTPATRKGAPVDVMVEVAMEFKLR
jgi:periplasmic protein TonB